MAERMTQSFLNRNSVFSRNLAFILERCWTPLDAETAIQRTWITESVLFSAEYPCAPVLSAATCASDYLIQQLHLFPTPSPAKPSGNWHSSKRAWEELGMLFQQWRKRQNHAMELTATRRDGAPQ
jgi:hypothetical protein